jgi:hypothetical protein
MQAVYRQGFFSMGKVMRPPYGAGKIKMFERLAR